MNRLPIVSFLSSSLKGKELFPPDRLDDRLPLSQIDFTKPNQSFWTYRLYFQAIQEILSKDSYWVLREAMGRRLSLPANHIEIQKVMIYSEKHGNWYHPAKVEVYTRQGSARLVLNVALTERGRFLMGGEISALEYLSRNFTYLWIPRVYSSQESISGYPMGTETVGEPFSLFLADWFEGFHEFHLSRDPLDSQMKLVLWDGSPTPQYLNELQTSQVYREISRILTLYYNPSTYDQIFPWHHGSGDFVVKVDRGRPEVRLVTVRNYGPLADPAEMTPQEALLFFFLNLSLRMRLDRLEGTGDTVWAGDSCLQATWEGFLAGLKYMESEERLDATLGRSFFWGLTHITLEDLTERFSSLLGSYNPDAPDLPLIKQNLVSHILLVYNILTQMENWRIFLPQ